MPALGAFLRQASCGVLESTVPPHTAAAWTTFLTGKDPGQHGVIDFVRFDPAARRFQFHDSSMHRNENILTLLSNAGISCGSIFLPCNYPPYPLSGGYIVSGFETPHTRKRFTEPQELRDEVLGVSPDLHFNFEEDWEDDASDAAFARNIDHAITAVDVLERLALHFQRERPTRLQIAFLQATDILFHKAWAWCRAGGQPFQAAGHELRHELVRKFFRRVDQMLSHVFGLHGSAAPQCGRPNDQTRTLRLICSDHGHGCSAGRIFVNSLLSQWGYLAPPGRLRRATQQLALLALDAAARHERSRELILDWRRTKAYMAHAGSYGFVYLNLKGREPEGLVAPEEFESVREALSARFLAEKIPGSNEPLFRQVLKGEQVYARKQELHLPDLVLVPADGFCPRKKLSRGPPVRLTPREIGGVHRREGIYALEGQGILASPGLGPRAGLADLAPTLLAALGQPVPQSMTGKPLLHLFGTPPPVKVLQEQPAAEARQNLAAPTVYSKAEEEEIEKRLLDLGYLE